MGRRASRPDGCRARRMRAVICLRSGRYQVCAILITRIRKNPNCRSVQAVEIMPAPEQSAPRRIPIEASAFGHWTASRALRRTQTTSNAIFRVGLPSSNQPEFDAAKKSATWEASADACPDLAFPWNFFDGRVVSTSILLTSGSKR